MSRYNNPDLPAPLDENDPDQEQVQENFVDDSEVILLNIIQKDNNKNYLQIGIPSNIYFLLQSSADVFTRTMINYFFYSLPFHGNIDFIDATLDYIKNMTTLYTLVNQLTELSIQARDISLRDPDTNEPLGRRLFCLEMPVEDFGHCDDFIRQLLCNLHIIDKDQDRLICDEILDCYPQVGRMIQFP